MPELRLPLRVARQVVHWFRDAGGRAGEGAIPGSSTDSMLGPERMPVYIWEYAPGRMFYGFPDLGRGIKIGIHHEGREIRAEELRQDVGAAEIDEVEAIAASYLSIEPVFNGSSVCMYTNTPDEDFIIDEYPGWPRVLILSPCSGHGFKFSSVVGKIASDWAMGRGGELDLQPFRLGRFG